MPTPYDYTVAQPNVGSYFDAMRQGRADRLTAENDQKMNALSRYLPGALQGNENDRAMALQSAPVDQMAALKQTFMQMDAPKLQAVKDLRAKGAAGATWAKTPEQWATVQATLRAEAQAAGLPFKEVPFEQKDAMAAMGQTVDSLIDQAYKEKMLANDTSRTNAQNAASYASAAASRAAAARTGSPQLTIADRREIYDTDDLVGANKAALSLLRQALTLSNKSYQGPGSQTVAGVMSVLGNKDADNTIEFDNLLQQQVLPQLKAIFGGMPTEGERKILLDLQGSSSLQRSVRNSIINTAIRLADARLRFNMQKAKQLRNGTYYNEAPSFDLAPPPGGAPAATSDYSDVDAILGLTK